MRPGLLFLVCLYLPLTFSYCSNSRGTGFLRNVLEAPRRTCIIGSKNTWRCRVLNPIKHCCFFFFLNIKVHYFLSFFTGFPAIIVAISLAATQAVGYGNAHACWLDVSSGMIWAFIAPAITIILVSKNFLRYKSKNRDWTFNHHKAWFSQETQATSTRTLMR